MWADGLRFDNVLLDTGSSSTWLPANGGASSLRLAGGSAGRCVPQANFTHRYADGSFVRGVCCFTELLVAGVRFNQTIGAATHVAEESHMQAAGLSMAGGVLSLSPADESSFTPLLSAAPHDSRFLTLCVPRRHHGYQARL
ncbi:MAG: hypothetical protein SGPRY_005010, partial [Prymnesium sp.]